MDETVLTSTQNLCLRAKKRKNIYPCKPQFYYIRDVRGYTLHGHVLMMNDANSVSARCFGVRVSLMFHFMFVH